jgi:HEAT repeat protein
MQFLPEISPRVGGGMASRLHCGVTALLVLASAALLVASTVVAQSQRPGSDDAVFGLPSGIERTDWKTWLQLNKDRFMRRPVNVSGLTATTSGVTAKRASRTHVSALVEATGSSDAIVRANAVYALGMYATRLEEAERRVIYRLLEDGDVLVRERALMAVGLTGRSDAVPGLAAIVQAKPAARAMTNVPTDRERGIAALALGLIGGPAAVDALADQIESKDNTRSIRACAIAAVGVAAGAEPTAKATERVRKALGKIVGDERGRSDLRALSLISMSRWGDAATVDWIVDFAGDSDSTLRRAAMFACAAWVTTAKASAEGVDQKARGANDARSRPEAAVLAGLDDASIDVRTAAISALAEVGGEDAASAFAKGRTAANRSIRRFSIVSCGIFQRMQPAGESAALLQSDADDPEPSPDADSAFAVARALSGARATNGDGPVFDDSGPIRANGYVALSYALSSDHPSGLMKGIVQALDSARSRLDRHNILSGFAAMQPTSQQVDELRKSLDQENDATTVTNRLSLLILWHDLAVISVVRRVLGAKTLPAASRAAVIEAIGEAARARSGDPLQRLSAWHDPTLAFDTLEYVLAWKW